MSRIKFEDLKMALYCASIIIGAGLLTLPLAAARLGFGPLLIAIILIGLYIMLIYQRLAQSMYAYLQRAARRLVATRGMDLRAASGGNGSQGGRLLNEQEIIAGEIRERGSRQLVEQAREAGLGSAGWLTIILGMFFYVFFADVGYILIGARSLAALSEFLSGITSPLFAIGLLGGAGLLMVVAWQFERLFPRPFLLRGTLKKLFALSGAWLAGISLLMILPESSPGGSDTQSVTAAIGLVLFVGAVLVGMFTRVNETESIATNKLNDQHTVNVMVASFEILLLFFTIGITLWVAANHQLFVPFYLVAPEAFSLQSLGAWADLIGLVIFAYVGTGIFNLCIYPSLFETSGGKRSLRLARVVVLGTAIPMIVYLAWSLTSATVLAPTTLLDLDLAKEYSTIGIERRFASFDTVGALLIAVFGYFVALLAVTSACNGFTESLADQVGVALEDINRSKWLTGGSENLRIRLVILVVAMMTAFSIDQLVTIDISSILAVAGNAGGGLLLLILPFFLPPAGRRKTTWASIVIGATTALILTLLGLNAADIGAVNDTASAIVAGITVTIALSIGGMAFWLIRSEPGPGDEETIVESAVRQQSSELEATQ